MIATHSGRALTGTSVGACCFCTPRHCKGEGFVALVLANILCRAKQQVDYANKKLYRALCPSMGFYNSLTLTICCIASHRGDYSFCTSSAGLHSFLLPLLP